MKFYKQDPIEQHKDLEKIKLFKTKMEYMISIIFTIVVSLAILSVIVVAAVSAFIK